MALGVLLHSDPDALIWLHVSQRKHVTGSEEK